MALTHEDLVGLLGPGNVVLADSGELRALGVPDDARRVLSEIGMPREAAGDVAAARPRILEIPGDPDGYLLLASRTAQDFALDLRTGEVVRFSRFEPGAYRLMVNSDLTAFVACLAMYAVVLRDIPEDCSDEEAQAWADRLEQSVREIDPVSLAVEDSFYAGVVFEISNNMF
ncbi:MAG: hypothetical protein HOV79_13035 [Hamadaea sp.]|nr:hypothetical protein [Hamadaea sp.]